MSITNTRRELGTVLSAALPGFAVFPSPESLDEITKPTLAFERSRVERAAAAPMSHRTHSFNLFVIAPQHAGEDALDTYLDDVLEVLDDKALTAWDSAERRVYGENPCYVITLTQTAKKN